MLTEILPPAGQHDIVLAPRALLEGEILAPGEGTIRVVACPHPFRVARIEFAAEPGLTIADILALAQPDPVMGRYAHVWIGDMKIPRENWRLVRPKPGTRVTVRMVPMDGGGGGGKKNPLRTVLTIAVLAAGAAVSGGALAGLGGAFAAGGIGAQIGGLAIPIAGDIVVNQERAP